MLFVEFPAFTRAVTKLPDDDYAIFQNELVADPEQGALIRGTGGFRKARMAFPSAGVGKSGVPESFTFILQSTKSSSS
jgi:hypothetical protein